eukprot:TRINITY_DN1085_c0_g1_i1.p1 TRINITY_DN1085_c0_g1~~TRINITY_DN1085_c0_g1_i1.p1  ORF type:complete len:245 (+),score=46.41 TRINITY_DN1085_c0_g1_i1:36-737(+)
MLTRPIALLIIAHPDDECMFFTPTIKNLQNEGYEVKCFCATKGTWDNSKNGHNLEQGEVRASELCASCHKLGIDDVYITHEETFLDGKESHWNIMNLKNSIKQEIRNTKAKLIVTFDEEGVSGHPNHCNVSKACKQVSLELSIDLLNIVTISLPFKYFSFLFIPFCIVIRFFAFIVGMKMEGNFCLPHYAFRCMRCHKSQLVWFRYIYLMFSVYTFYNMTVLYKQSGDSKKLM